MSNNIEDRSVSVSVKMLWTAVISMAIGCFSLAGIYYTIQQDVKDNRAEMRDNKSQQRTVDAIQDLKLENMLLNAKKLEMDYKEMQKLINNKQDKK